MGSQTVSSESDIFHLILVYRSRNNNSGPKLSSSDSSGARISVIFGSKWDPLTTAWRQGGTSPERLAELPTGVSPLQKRIWKWDFYHCFSCNFFFHICFCHLWCELPLNFQTCQNEIFQSVPELSGTYRSCFDVKSFSSMSSEAFWEIYWYSGLQALFVTVFHIMSTSCAKKSYKGSSLLGYFDCFLSDHTVGCYNINFSCLSKIRREKFCFASNVVIFLLYFFAWLQLSRCYIWPTFHHATPNLFVLS